MGLPVIYIAYYNSEKGFLREVPREVKEIDDTFGHFRHIMTCRVQVGNASAKSIFNHLGAYGTDLTIFHYSGHATGQHLNLEDKYTTEQLMAVFADRCPKLVFLNGCRTKGFAQKLLEIGVGAVIATSTNVLDSIAADFSVNFYNEFTSKGTSLKAAFERATSVFNESKSKYVGPTRSLVTDESEPLAFNLYYQDDDVLDWKLVNLNRAQAGILDDEVRGLYAEIESIKEQAESYEDEFDTHYRDNQGNERPDESLDGRQKTRKTTLLKKLHEFKETIEQKEEAIAEVKMKQLHLEQADSFRKSLLKLNYTDQLLLVNQYFVEPEQKPHFGAFIILGSSRCGIEVLQEKILLKLRVTNTQRRVVRVQGRAGTVSAVSFWERLRVDLKLREKEPAKIIGEIYSRYLTSVDLIVEYITDPTVGMPAAQLDEIKNFWRGLVTHSNGRPADSLKCKRLILFVLDKVNFSSDAQLNAVPVHLKSRADVYRNAFDHSASHVLSLPPIGPVPVQRIREWYKNEELEDWAYKQLDYSAFEPEAYNYVLSAIEKICKQMLFHEVFHNHFNKYLPLSTANNL